MNVAGRDQACARNRLSPSSLSPCWRCRLSPRTRREATRIRGTVEKLDDHTLTVKSRDGQPVTVTLAPNVTVAYLVKKSLADIKAGDFVASTSVKETDGKNHSVELRIFPEAMRGLGEGQYAWDLGPGSLMTNATVSGVTARRKAKL